MGTIGELRALTRVVAHRGLHSPIGPAENSLGAFRAAVAAGADVLETDSHRTLDGVLVAFHDRKLADGRRIKDLRFDELPLLHDGQTMPRISEIADLARDAGVRLTVEPKRTGHEAQLLEELGARLASDRYEVISFSPTSIKAVEAANPAIVTGTLSPRIPGQVRESFAWTAAAWLLDKLDWQPALNRATRQGADYVSVHHRLATPRFLDEAARRGIAVDVWTANDPSIIRRLLDANVRSIVTDHADLALRMRDGATDAAAGAATLTRGAA